MSVVLTILSMSGLPPLMGFVGKFLIFNFLFLSQKYIYILVFSLLNFFSIYFYIQNIFKQKHKDFEQNFTSFKKIIFLGGKDRGIFIIFKI